MSTLEIMYHACIGVGLAAACGFRIFLPPFIMSIAALNGQLELNGSFEHLGTYPAVIILGVATLAEVGAYYLPWFDNLLDSVASPAAVLAGVLVTGACLTGMDPTVQWTLAAIAGGGGAAVVQAGTVAARAVSSVTTGGVGNPVVSTGEGAAATGLSLTAIFLPILAMVLFVVAAYFAVRYIRRYRAQREAPESA
jgi:hypothetical protein